VPLTLKSTRCAVALALLGMAFNALWPLLANAEPRAGFLPTEICSGSGKAAGAAVGKLPPQLPAPKHPNLHCAFCASGAGNAPLAGALPQVVLVAGFTEPVLQGTAVVHNSNHGFLLAEPRAPPVFLLL
jgi:hypothetical protein